MFLGMQIYTGRNRRTKKIKLFSAKTTEGAVRQWRWGFHVFIWSLCIIWIFYMIMSSSTSWIITEGIKFNPRYFCRKLYLCGIWNKKLYELLHYTLDSKKCLSIQIKEYISTECYAYLATCKGCSLCNVCLSAARSQSAGGARPVSDSLIPT